MPNKTHAAALLTAALAALTACERDKSAEYRMDSAAGTVVNEATWIRDSLRTDALIMGTLSATNKMEINASQVAEDRASDAEVRTFAAMMVDDHVRLNKRADSLGKALKISPLGPPDAFEENHQQIVDSLRRQVRDTTAKASPFDRAYIDQQVRAHRQVLELINVSIERAQNADLKKALVNEVRPAVAGHLQRAESILRRISG